MKNEMLVELVSLAVKQNNPQLAVIAIEAYDQWKDENNAVASMVFDWGFCNQLDKCFSLVF